MSKYMTKVFEESGRVDEDMLGKMGSWKGVV